MREHHFLSRVFLMTGAALAVIGLILWYTLPIPSMFPPYLVTAALALGYGVACRFQAGGGTVGKS